MDTTLKKAVKIKRVSSKRQKEEGASLEAQDKIIEDYRIRNGFTIVKDFEADESAKNGDRKVFQLMVAFLKENPDVQYVICEKTDRLLRGNLKDRVVIDELINDYNKTFVFVKEGLVLDKNTKSAQKLHFDIQNALARHFLNNLSDEVKKGYDVLVDNGFYPHILPIGYKTKLEDHVAVIDDAVAPFIKRAYELCATGDYSEKRISQVLYEEGFRSRKGNKVGKSTIGKILHDPFYIGDFVWKDEVRHGNHEPIVIRDLFNKVQEVLSPKQKRGHKHDFAFVGLMRCGECQNGITAELQKGHVYYHCTKPRGADHCSQKYVREEVISEQLEKVIKAVALDIQKIKSIKEVMRVSLADETQYVQESLDALHAQYKDLQEQSSKLLDLYLRGKVKEEVYNNKSAKLNKEMEDVDREIAKHKGADRQYHREIEGFLVFCKEAPALFKSSRPALKRELLHFVVSNLVLKDGKVDFKLKIPFSIVAKYAKTENWQGWRESNPHQRFWRPLFYH